MIKQFKSGDFVKGTKEFYKHCDTDSTFITLHDCYSKKISLNDDILSFDFENGFWITSGHKHNNLNETVRTDPSRVDFCIRQDDCDEMTIYVFQKKFFGSTIRKEWSLDKLIDLVNNRGFSIEFLYQYESCNAQIIVCWLHFNKKPYHYECQIKISVSKVIYYWNNLCKNQKW